MYSLHQVVRRDGERVEGCKVCTSIEKECDFDWRFGDTGPERGFGEGVLKIFSGLLVVLKGTQCNNLYYLKGSAVTEKLTALEHLDDKSTWLWHSRLGQISLNSLQALAIQELLKGALT